MKKIAIVALLATILLSASASTAVEDSTFVVGEKWAFGTEIDLMEEVSSEISELENNMTELMSGEEAEMLKDATGLELKSFELDNEAILGFYYTGEVIDDFDSMVHMKTEQSLYSHTVFGTNFTTMLPGEGEHNLLLKYWCEDEDWDEENEQCGDDDDAGKFELLDNNTGEPLVLEEVETELGGSMHYVAKITEDTWWTQDTHELVKTQITVALGAAGSITIKNVPNITFDGVSILDLGDDGEEPEYDCADGSDTIPFYWVNDGYEDCYDGSDEPGNGYDFECDNGDTYPMDYVNDGMWNCENGEDEGESGDDGSDDPFSVCEENEEEKAAYCYETIEHKLETAVLEMSSEASMSILFDFGDNPMNVMDLPLDENKYWEGELDRLIVSGDLGGSIDFKKPELSLCPNLNCDELPEMQELYSELSNAIQEIHDDGGITIDRNDDGLPDVITEWNDIFPMYIPETWMDQIFQQILEEISCEDDESAQEGEECDEQAEEEFEKLNLRIENNRFAFGPYSLHDVEGFEPIPYAFETEEKKSVKGIDGNNYEGYQVLPTDQCSEKNPERDDDDCDDREEDDDGDGGDGGIVPGGSRSDHDSDYEDGCEGDPFCNSEIIWFHDAVTGHPAYINMDMPNLKEDGYTIEMTPIDPATAEAQIEANADTDNPSKTTLIDVPVEEVIEDEGLFGMPGFGIIAAGGSLLFISRRFRK